MWSVEFTDKHGDIKYRFYEKFKDPLTGKDRRTSVVMNKDTKQSQKEAQARLNERIAAILERSNGSHQSIEDKTFYSIAMEWLEEYKTFEDAKIGTIKRKESEVRQMFNYFDKDALFVKITFKYLQDFFYYKHREGLAHSSLSSYSITLRAIYKYARTGNYRFEPDFKLSDLRIPKEKKTPDQLVYERNENKYLTDAEIKDIFDYIDYKIKVRARPDVLRNLNMIKHIIEFQMLNGMRISELMAIEPHNIDFDNKRLKIDGSIFWAATPEGFGYKDTTKTDSSTRDIVLTQRSIDILKNVILQNKKETRWNDSYKDRGFVFTGSTGSPMPKDKVNTILREAADWTGLDKRKKVTTHILRHTHISKLAALNIGLKTIMHRVGHSDYKTTLSIYTHITDEMHEDTMQKLENANL